MLCLGLSGMAQNNEKKEFERKYSALTQEVANARKQKDYKKSVETNGQPLNQSKVIKYQPPEKGLSTLWTAQNKNCL